MGATLVKSRCRYRPVGGHVFVRVVQRERRSAILMPESIEASAQLWEGVVLMVGPGRLQQGAKSNEDRISPNCKVGDRVVFTRHSCINIDDEAPDVYLVGEDNIIAVRQELE